MLEHFAHPFSRTYWQSAFRELTKTRILTYSAISIALRIALGSVFIPLPGNLRIYFTFFFTALEGCLCGPVMALINGFIADMLGFMMFPSGPFFFGYTLSSMAGGLIYALLLYRCEITVLRLALSKLLVNLLVNVLLGSTWSFMMYSKGYLYYFTQSIIKNSLLLPLEIIGLVLFFNALLPFLEKRNLVCRQPRHPIPWFRH